MELTKGKVLKETEEALDPFLNQEVTGCRLVHAEFLEIAFVFEVGIPVFVRVCHIKSTMTSTLLIWHTVD